MSSYTSPLLRATIRLANPRKLSIKYPIPAFIEYEYKGAGTSQEEVAKCYQYCKDVLA